ncbi:MAG: CopG family transcriptional regulator [bacterium]|nr:CopG family transcriptional regulator [bacterium]
MQNNFFSKDIEKLIGKKKETKKVKTFYLSESTIAKIMEIYAKEGGRQSRIIEEAVDLYYKLYKILGKAGIEKLRSDAVLEKLKELL